MFEQITLVDHTISEYLVKVAHPYFLDLTSQILSASIYLAAVGALAIVHYWWIKGKASQRYAVWFSGLLAALLALTEILKRVIDRIRPDGEPFSFPSRHATLAFYIALTLPVEKKWRAVLITWACAVSFSRLWLNVHWMSDVLVGIGIGVAAGFLFLKVKDDPLDSSHSEQNS